MTGFDSAFSWGEYSGSLRKLIHLLKYGGCSPLAVPLGALLGRALPRSQSFDAIVPMPLHWRRRIRRGFNQSELLARELSRRSGVPVVAGAMRRRKATPPQAGLTAAERRTNMSGAFEVRDKQNIRGRHILLVDDVLTTGATAGACAAVLKRAGAARVTVLTLARVDRRMGVAAKSIS